VWLCCALALPAIAADPAAQIRLNEKEYLEGPGFAFLLFHNNYMVGRQGGLQMILDGERVLDSGDLYVIDNDGSGSRGLTVLRRTVDRDRGTATVHGDAKPWGAGYRLITRTDGRRVLITLQLDQPFDWGRVREAGLRFYIYPATYYHHSFEGAGTIGTFARQFAGSNVLVGGAKTLTIGADIPLHSFEISSSTTPLVLRDERSQGASEWFSISAPFRSGSTETELTVEITPALHPEWRRIPVIGFSQAGYHPEQQKRAVLELDARDEAAGEVELYRTGVDGMKLVQSGRAKPWGRFLANRYATFDFTNVREPGMYVIEYGGQKTKPFPIGEDVLETAWRPTLQWFLPVQMCHVDVKEGGRTWHGPCHLDDALQAPENHTWIDGYQQGKRETKFADNEHIPGLDWGGWHDAGDHDLPTGSVAETTLILALAQEEFKPTLDQTSIDRKHRLVRLNVPDGKPDLLQQIQFGAESLIAMYRPAGHVFAGIIESSNRQYGHVGDPVNITDNLVYEPTLREDQRNGDHSGKRDDRWVFTNRNTGLQYEVAQSLAAASRALRGFNDPLAGEALDIARKLWNYEQANAPVYAPNAYVPRDSGYSREEIAATAELAITDPDGPYRARLTALLPKIRSASAAQFGEGPGWTLVRALRVTPDPELQQAVRQQAKAWAAVAKDRADRNPYGVRYPDEVLKPEWKLESRSGIHSGFVWGHGWDLQSDAVAQYYYHKHLPDLFDSEPLFAGVNFVLGCHPANNRSFVTGVGADSALVAYGINRNDWTGIPGGVISGVSLVKPEFMELKEFPYLWYQTEYVIGGAATYIFDVLAAQSLVKRPVESR
jgi:hypothetical protein